MLYTRYKPRKKEKRFVKFFLIIIAVTAIVYFAYEYRSAFMFWKYNISKLDKELIAINQNPSAQMRLQLLKELEKKCESYKSDNPFSADAHFSSGKVKVLIGEALMPVSFERLLESDNFGTLSIEVRKYFLEAIKDFKKGQALNDGRIDDNNRMLMAKACFLAGYYAPHELVPLLCEVKNLDLLSLETKRLYATILVLGGNEAKGLEILKSENQTNSPLFMATVYRMIGKNTEAILQYRKALEKEEDSDIKTLIHFNLGRIYFAQSLYMEAAKEFSEAITISPNKAYLKMWAGKSFAALGDKQRAQEVWRDALKIDPENEEIKKLLTVR